MSGPTAQFDDVATTYDDHRQFPTEVGERLRDVVVARLPAGGASLLLEVGVGTGRIAAPFVLAGCRYVGLDGSAAMLRRCQEKLGGAAGGNLALVRGDMRLLPFPSRRFDAVIAAGVFRPFLRRLSPAGGAEAPAPPWRSAAIEASRVLRRPGVLAIVKHRPEPGSLEDVLGRRKRQWLRQARPDAAGGDGADDAAVARFFVEHGATAETIEAGGWSDVRTPRTSIARYLHGSQVGGRPWAAQLARALERDALELYGSLDAQARTGWRLDIIVVRFGAAERT